MRIKNLLVLLIAAWPFAARAADTIAPGMGLAEVKATLEKHGYEVGPKHALQRAAGSKADALEWCRIDREITLAIQYQRSTNQITSLGLILIPPGYSSKLDEVIERQAIEIQFEAGGVYTLKLHRKPDRATSAK